MGVGAYGIYVVQYGRLISSSILSLPPASTEVWLDLSVMTVTQSSTVLYNVNEKSTRQVDRLKSGVAAGTCGRPNGLDMRGGLAFISPRENEGGGRYASTKLLVSSSLSSLHPHFRVSITYLHSCLYRSNHSCT